jgi:transposase
MVGSSSLLDAISIAMEPWTTEHRVFVFETFIETGSSVVLTQRKFRTHFNVGRHGAVPSRNTILKWVKNFRTTGSVRPGTARGGDRTVRTPENIERIRQAVENLNFLNLL